jgi:hypothetical protein
MSPSVADLLRSATALHSLTLWQPWATAVAELGKDVENRGWEPPASLLGRCVAIHAGQTYDNAGAEGIRKKLSLAVPGRHSCPKGVVLAVAVLTRAVRGSSSPWAVPGQVHWQLEGAVKLGQPVPCKGAQGLWQLPLAVFDQVREQVLGRQAQARAALALSPTEGPPSGLEKVAAEAWAETRASRRVWSKGSGRGAGPAQSSGTVYVARNAEPLEQCWWCGLYRWGWDGPHAARIMRTDDPGWPVCEHGKHFLANCAWHPTPPECCWAAWVACGGPLAAPWLAAQVLP